MEFGLISLGSELVRVIEAVFTSLVFDFSNAAADSIKPRTVQVEHFRQVLITDTNEIMAKINSLTQSKLLAAHDYVKKGLIVMQDLLPSDGFSISTHKNSADIMEYYILRTTKVEQLIQAAQRFFAQAETGATEAFKDKENVNITMRLEAIRIQLFCTMILHWDKPHQWLEKWRLILISMIRDKDISQTVLTINPWLSRQRKVEIKSTLISVTNEAAGALSRLAHENVSLADAAADTLTYIKSPSVMDEKYFTNWQEIIGITNSTFVPWNGRLVIIIPECCRMCILSENRLCVIDRQFKITEIDTTTLRVCRMLNVPFDADQKYSSAAFDKKKNALLVVKSQPNELLIYDYSNSDDLKLKEATQLPEQGYSIFCTPFGNWILRGVSGKGYVSWKGNGTWTRLCDKVNIIYDVNDTVENAISGVRILTDTGIETFYQDSSVTPSCLISNQEDLKLLKIFQNRDAIQTMLSFDDENLLVAYKMKSTNQISLSYIYRKDEDEFSMVNVNNILPIKFDDTLEALLVQKNAIFIGTKKKHKLTPQEIVDQSVKEFQTITVEQNAKDFQSIVVS